MMTMRRVRFEVEPVDEELLAGLLWMAGCGGVVSGGDGVLAASGEPPAGLVVVEAFFESQPQLEAVLAAGFVPVAECDEEPQDYLAAWRLAAEPIAIAETLVIDPGEPEPGRGLIDEAGRRRIVVPARAAFGTGSHETTRLALDALVRRPPVAARMLDVGTGSGILAFVALALGAMSVAGFEIDLESALLAGQNARVNRMTPALWAGTLDALGSARFDLIVVNVLPERILDRAAELASRVAAGGRLIYAGHLVEREDLARAAWEAAGLVLTARERLGDWGLLELERP